MELDLEKAMKFAGHVVNELGAAATSSLVIVGDRLGLYRALAEAGPVTAAKLSEFTGTDERYLTEWLANQAASGYIGPDASKESFFMTPEQQAVFAHEDSPLYMVGGFYSIAALLDGESKLAEVFRNGKGIPWGDHHNCLFCGTAKFFKPSYTHHLIQEWIPALDGVTEKLDNGGKVADVGCGHGISTTIMAKTFPKSTFVGFDNHKGSIEAAREHAKKAGVSNVEFEVSSATEYPGSDYDLVTFFDCLHDMGDPTGASAHVKQSLNPDGTMMVVEPFAGDTLSENLNPIGRVYYAFSATVCIPASKSQEVAASLGAQAGEKKLKEAITAGGFTRFKRAAETPFNIVLEARP